MSGFSRRRPHLSGPTDIEGYAVNVKGDVDVNPWIFSAGIGYRFNLGDLFGHRAETAYIK
ncbi:MAG: hypothetical protein ABWY38_07720 [Methyloceanibacter sp.]